MPKQIVDLRKIKRSIQEKTIQEKKNEPAETKTKKYIPDKIEWVATEFTKHEKEKKWFVIPAIIALTVIIISIILKNFLLVIMAVLTSFVIYIYAVKEPGKIKFSISGKGVRVNKTIYKFDDLKSFWIFYEPPEVKELSLRSKKMFMPYIKIPLGKQSPIKVRKILLQFLPERKHQESIVDEFTRKARF